MLTVIIVEDEADHRLAIESFIDWMELGLLLQATAVDGLGGLDAVRRHRPDILILDVNMPRMTGIELARLARQELPEIKLLFLSGHDNFDYLKSALSVAAVDYLLKPVSPADLNAALDRIARTCRAEAVVRQESNLARQRLAESFPLLRERFIRDLLTGRPLPERIGEKLAYLQLNTGSLPWYVLTVRTSDRIVKTEVEELQRRALVESLDQLPELSSRLFYAWTGDRELSIVLGSTTSEVGKVGSDIDLLCWHVCWHYRAIQATEPVIGISRPVHRLEDLRHGLSESLEALACHRLEDPSRVVHHADIMVARADPEALDEIEAALLRLIRTGDSDGCASLLLPWYVLLDQQAPSLGWIQGLSINLIMAAWRAASRVTGEPGLSPLECAETWNAIALGKDVESIAALVVDRCRRLARAVILSIQHRTSGIVARAQEIIQEKFAENLTLADLAARENITPYYFGNLFKKETGVSFADYLNSARMEHAHRLLVNTEMLTYEVAAACGYLNASYFCSQFKNHFGLSPKQFRERIRQ